MTPERKHYLKVALLVYLCWIVAFELVGRYAATLPTHNPTLAIDHLIPLRPEFIWFYELCYVFPLLPLVVVDDFHRLNILLLSIVLANISAFAIYLAYPIAFPRPELGNSLAEKILATEYAADFQPGANKLPSMHVAFAWLVYFAVRGQIRRPGEWTVLLVAFLITLSALFVKQHIVLDVVAGILWAFLAWGLANRLYPRLTDPNAPPQAALKRLIKNLLPGRRDKR